MCAACMRHVWNWRERVRLGQRVGWIQKQQQQKGGGGGADSSLHVCLFVSIICVPLSQYHYHSIRHKQAQYTKGSNSTSWLTVSWKTTEVSRPGRTSSSRRHDAVCRGDMSVTRPPIMYSLTTCTHSTCVTKHLLNQAKEKRGKKGGMDTHLKLSF